MVTHLSAITYPRRQCKLKHFICGPHQSVSWYKEGSVTSRSSPATAVYTSKVQNASQTNLHYRSDDGEQLAT